MLSVQGRQEITSATFSQSVFNAVLIRGLRPLENLTNGSESRSVATGSFRGFPVCRYPASVGIVGANRGFLQVVPSEKTSIARTP